jgi:hypothetical protein
VSEKKATSAPEMKKEKISRNKTRAASMVVPGIFATNKIGCKVSKARMSIKGLSKAIGFLSKERQVKRPALSGTMKAKLLIICY